MARKRDSLKQPGDAGSGLSKVQAHPTRYTLLMCATLCAPRADCHQHCAHSPPPLQALGVRCSMPDWLLHELASTVLPEHEALGAWAEANQRPPRLALRVNPLRASVEEVHMNYLLVYLYLTMSMST